VVAPAPRADRGLDVLYDAFDALPVLVEKGPYGDDLVNEVRQQLLTLDGVLVWVNPHLGRAGPGAPGWAPTGGRKPRRVGVRPP
jgi:hypothetical protein